MEVKEKMVSMYDPSVDAFRQVPVSLAQKFLDGVDDLKAKVAEVEIEMAKDAAYQESLKSKK